MLRVKACADYTGTTAEDLSFVVGDEIAILDTRHEDWYIGNVTCNIYISYIGVLNGKYGFVPRNCIPTISTTILGHSIVPDAYDGDGEIDFDDDVSSAESESNSHQPMPTNTIAQRDDDDMMLQPVTTTTSSLLAAPCVTECAAVAIAPLSRRAGMYAHDGDGDTVGGFESLFRDNFWAQSTLHDDDPDHPAKNLSGFEALVNRMVTGKESLKRTLLIEREIAYRGSVMT